CLALPLREHCSCGQRQVAVAWDELGAAFEQTLPELELARARADAKRVGQLVRPPAGVVARRSLKFLDQLDGATKLTSSEVNECGDRERRGEHLPITALSRRGKEPVPHRGGLRRLPAQDLHARAVGESHDSDLTATVSLVRSDQSIRPIEQLVPTAEVEEAPQHLALDPPRLEREPPA